MSRAPSNPVQMACLTIGHYDYLMPAAAAMKVAELMTNAFECDRDYGERDYSYTPKDQPRVSFSLVRPNQVRVPPGTPASTVPRLLK